jgi:IS30 family transposase
MILHGTSLKGEKNSKAKLTEGDVENIRRRAENGEVLRILAKEFHVNKSTIERIVKRHTWTHI